MAQAKGFVWEEPDKGKLADPYSQFALDDASPLTLNRSLIFSKVDARPWEQILMGKVRRSPITGGIHLRSRANFPDFLLADLFTRNYLNGTLKRFLHDEYLFRPVPLLYRTWLYHQFYRQQAMPEESNEYGMIAQALGQVCIDAPVTAGRWSPILCYGPMLMALSFFGDMTLMVFAAAAFALLALITLTTNTPSLYGYARLITLPLRAAVLVLTFWRYSALERATALALLGLAIALILFLLDLLGDLDQVRNYRHHCTYEVMRPLPNRVLLCKRMGAEFYEDDFGSHGEIPEAICGLAQSDQKHILIADLYGILVELRPLKVEDWQDLADDRDLSKRKDLTFVGLDVYNKDTPSIRDLDEPEGASGRAKAGEATVKPQSDVGDVLMENL
eukprot:CAMPEP_0171175390 /NCGR_PEP_ID=MMETSP0790-20130122/11205_1 /TAXON_ID=2925 /ORGANISM="Alexandrium catenella, Strain OF101" /LENGTH=388 /DNA_ID=CAMNT_0011640267 /DNA_START=9 /DNA_END=1175 /DNA_ORIENTATION=-